MDAADIRLLYEYNYWATHKILAATERVSPEQFVAPSPHSFGSLRGTLVHLVGGERGWRTLWQRNSLEVFGALKAERYPTFEPLKSEFEAEERAMREYVAGLAEPAVDGLVRYTTPEGVTRERVLWHCLVHVVNHGTHHRSEAATILKGFGQPPGALDFTAFLNQVSR